MRTPTGLQGWMRLLLVLLVVYRVLYHLLYIGNSPFALGTFSDGRLYEIAAFDIVRHPPLGTQAFYLQGLYAYFLAIPTAISVKISYRLLLQLLVAWLSLWLFYRTATSLLGRRQAMLSTLVLLAYPMLAFYENKFVSAQLGITCNILSLWAFSAFVRRPTVGRAVGSGAAAGLAVLARPNMLLALPFVAIAMVLVVGAGRRERGRVIGAFTVGIVLSLAPMAARNHAVTGQATVFPAHGGGTSFYIGNNPGSSGVWNTAGGLITGQVLHEQGELVEELGLGGVSQRRLPGEIGRALYGRAFRYIAEQPVDYVALQAKKLWLTLGNDELTQDYDRWGEREMIPWSSLGFAPFATVLGLGVLGGLLLARNGREEAEPPAHLRPWLVVLLGHVVAVLVANVVFFTSAQHRLPLVVPLVGLHGAARGVPVPPWIGVPSRPTILAILIVVGLSLWPRSRVTEPSAIHYHNLAVVQDWIGEPRRALATLDIAVERRPDHPVIRLERAKLARRMQRLDLAASDLDDIIRMPGAPAWVVERARLERELVEVSRVEVMLSGGVPR